MKNPLEELFECADNHAEDTGEFDHAVGDLQGLLREAYKLMSPSQKLAFLASDEVTSLVEAGARDEYEQDDLVQELKDELEKVVTAVETAGYRLLEGEMGFYWDHASAEHDSLYFPTKEDAAMDAWNLLNENKGA